MNKKTEERCLAESSWRRYPGRCTQLYYSWHLIHAGSGAATGCFCLQAHIYEL